MCQKTQLTLFELLCIFGTILHAPNFCNYAIINLKNVMYKKFRLVSKMLTCIMMYCVCSTRLSLLSNI